MLAHGDDKPVWMTELGWSTLSTHLRARRPRRHQGGRRQPGRAGRLPHARPTAAWPTTPTSSRPPGSTSHDIAHRLEQRRAQPRPDHRRASSASPPSPPSRAPATATAIPCGGTLDSRRPAVSRSTRPTDGAALPHLAADPRHGDRRRGRQRHRPPASTARRSRSRRSRTATSASREVRVGRGQEPLLRPAHGRRDRPRRGQERRQAVAKVTHVGGGKYPYKVTTSYALKVGKVSGGKVTVRGKIAPKSQLISRLAHGRGYVFFSRFDTKAKRWKKVSRYSRDAKHAFTVRYRFKKRGVWRVTGPSSPRRASRPPAPRPRRQVQASDRQRCQRPLVSAGAGDLGGELGDLGRRAADAHALRLQRLLLGHRGARGARDDRARVAHRLAGRGGEARDVGDDRLGDVAPR